ncbi:hypothetical protein G6L41_017335 [Agrobacterium tumefaciens]|uniref:hypothetical protein n=1 Tax=Agrobacterium tumefaciens TaxID=358 RepID=UPI0015736499|nr:hypothetical protein [Agrobacterium tumefaciens]WCK15389.1 hypothetical protein G6L41_017335 [Agrobacterium tumefaciens]
MEKFALFDDDGLPTAFYSFEIHGDNIPQDTVEITEEEWREFIENPGRRQWIDGTIVTYDPAVEPQPEPVTVVYSVDLWTRMTDAEAEEVLSIMEQQPIRTRKIFDTANSYRSDHELWPLLQQLATTLFGEERAAEILAPSVV